MSDKHNVKFGINVDSYKNWDGMWNFGIGISHTFLGELYLYITFYKWSISIGWIDKELYNNKENTCES